MLGPTPRSTENARNGDAPAVEAKIGPRVDLVWVADSALSTGVFAGAHGTGIDHAYLSHNTAVQTGTITLAG